MDYFKCSSYTRTSDKFQKAYVENMTAYLRRLHPEKSPQDILSFVKSVVDKKLKTPKMEIIDYPSYGNAQLKTVDLLSYTDTLRKNIITPAGVLYKPPSVKESFLKIKITNDLSARKTQKKIMLTAAAQGDIVTEQRANYLQSSIKIGVNSIPGAFGSPFNFLFDIPNYNAVTSMSRHSIMCGYAHVEKMLEGNFYFPTLDSCINYCIQLIRLYPKHTMDVVGKYNFYIPTVDDVCDHFLESIGLYCRITNSLKHDLARFISSLSDGERTYVYYAYCLKTLLMKNANFFLPFLGRFFSQSIDIDASVSPDDIFKFNSDLRAVVSSLNADFIDRKPLSDAIKECPDGVRKLIAIGHQMQSGLDGIQDIISTFLRVDCDTPDAMHHPNMIRKAVIISDTDSVIFSTQSWVEWYCNGISFDQNAYEINGFVVLMLVLTLEQVFARLSTNFGIEGDDIYKISMKNEFLYPIMLRTPLPKQYAGIAKVQEGFVLPKYKQDIKGLSFRSSGFCPETAEAGNKFVNWIFDTVLKEKKLKAVDCIKKALDHEKRIIKSINDGDVTFLTTMPIRIETEYKNAAISVFHIWKFWDDVFKPMFGEFIIPNKGYDIPILNDGKALKDKTYLEKIARFDQALYERMCNFLEKNSRNITHIVMPMTIRQIPEILRPIVDVRSIVYANSTPFMVTLRSLGIGYTGANDQTLLSDIYA